MITTLTKQKASGCDSKKKFALRAEEKKMKDSCSISNVHIIIQPTGECVICSVFVSSQ